MAKNVIQLVVSALDRSSAVLKGIEGRLDAFQGRIEKAARASRIATVGLTTTGIAVGGLGLMAVKAAGRYEQSQIAFETMLGSAEDAQRLLNDLTTFARTTPFELTGLEDMTKRLLAFGIEQENVLKDLEVLGNISAGVGMDKLPNLILAFGQVSAATRLTGMELRQFTEAGVPLLDELAKTMNKPVKEIQKMVSEGQVGFPIVRQALQNLTAEGGRFEDLMGKQAKSLEGLWSNLVDIWGIFLREEGLALLDWAKEFVKFGIHIVEDVLPKWVAMTKQVVGWLVDHKEVLIVVAGAITGLLTPAVLALTAAFVAMGAALAPYMLTGVAIGGLVAGALYLIKNWDAVKQTVVALGMALKEWLVDKWQGVVESITAGVNKIKGVFQGMYDFVVGHSVVPDMVDAVIAEFGRMAGASSKEILKISQTWDEWFGRSVATLEGFRELSRGVWRDFRAGVGSAIGDAIAYGKDLNSSLADVMRQIASNVISALIQMGIERIAKSLLFLSLNAKEATSRMAVLASETYGGAFAATAAIPVVGPALAPGVAAAAQAAMLAGSVAAGAAGAAVGAGIAGIAHGGLSNVPREGTYLLDRGERVLAPEQNRDLKKFMAEGSGGDRGVIVEQLHIMPNASVDEALFDKPIEWWVSLAKKQILPALNVLGEDNATTTLRPVTGKI